MYYSYLVIVGVGCYSNDFVVHDYCALFQLLAAIIGTTSLAYKVHSYVYVSWPEN